MARVGRWAHLYTFIAQIVLAILMIILSQLPWSGANTPVTLVLAGMSAVLVLLYPMRMREERGSTRILALAFITLLFTLIIILSLGVGARFTTERPPLVGWRDGGE